MCGSRIHKAIFSLITSFLIIGCCPICKSDCFYTIEKNIEVKNEKYLNTHYIIDEGYKYNLEGIQESYVYDFRLYIDSISFYAIKEPFEISAFMSNEKEKIIVDSSKIRYMIRNPHLGIFIKEMFFEPYTHLKIEIKQQGTDNVVFEYDIYQKSHKARRSKRFESMIQF